MNKNNIKTLTSGFTLLEMMVSLAVFSILAIVTTQSLLTTLRISSKSQSVTKARSDVDYALSIMERNLHNASEVVNCSGQSATQISYLDTNGNAGNFSCVVGQTGYIASGSARITSETVGITECLFVCEPAADGVPAKVNVSINAKENTTVGEQSGVITTETTIYLRSY